MLHPSDFELHGGSTEDSDGYSKEFRPGQTETIIEDNQIPEQVNLEEEKEEAVKGVVDTIE